MTFITKRALHFGVLCDKQTLRKNNSEVHQLKPCNTVTTLGMLGICQGFRFLKRLWRLALLGSHVRLGVLKLRAAAKRRMAWWTKEWLKAPCVAKRGRSF